MINHILRTIEELKKQVQTNVRLISKNQDAIKHMLKHSRKDEYASQYEVFNNSNRDLLTRNNDLINVQLTLVNLLKNIRIRPY